MVLLACVNLAPDSLWYATLLFSAFLPPIVLAYRRSSGLLSDAAGPG
jgi:hypothetical protein